MLTIDQQIQVLNHLMPDCSRVIENGQLIWLDDRPMPSMQEMAGVWFDINLNEIKEQKCIELDRYRDECFTSGMVWYFAGKQDRVQTRPQDKINLISIAIKSILLEDTTTPIVKFRAQSNTDYLLTAKQAQAMALAASEHIEAIYHHSWVRKDQVQAATTPEEVEAIVWTLSF